MELKGVALAGGTRSRPFPWAKVTNKHLPPVGEAPMIWHPLWKLKATEDPQRHGVAEVVAGNLVGIGEAVPYPKPNGRG